MVALSYANWIIIVVSTAWIANCDSVEQISCSTTTMSSTDAKVFRYGDLLNPYPVSQTCHTIFEATNSELKFLILLKNSCDDVLNVYDSSTSADKQCCKDGCTKKVGVFQNPVHVYFASDSTTGPDELGFEVTVIVGKDESQCPSSSSPIRNIAVGTTPVIITSPNFPNSYPTSSKCRYIIESSDPSKGVTLSFDFINLDFQGQCYDKIILREDGENGNLIKEICRGYDLDNIKLPENETYNSATRIYLEFSSDDQVEGNGFRLHIRQASGTTNEVSSSTVQSTEASSSTTETTEALSSTVQTTIALSSTTETTEASSSTIKTTEALSSTEQTTETLSSTETPTSTVVPQGTVTVASQTTTTVSTVTADSQTTETILSSSNTAQTSSVTMVSQASTTQSTTELPTTTRSQGTVPASGLKSYFTESTIAIGIILIIFIVVVIVCVTVLVCIIVRKKKPKRRRLPQKEFKDYRLSYNSNQSPLYLYYWSVK